MVALSVDRQKTMYGGILITKCNLIFIFASETEFKNSQPRTVAFNRGLAFMGQCAFQQLTWLGRVPGAGRREA